MADITLSRIDELLRSMYELLWTKPEGMSAKDILAVLPEITQLAEYEQGYSPSTNIPRYERVIIRLATVPLVKAGWLFKDDRGRWYLTEEGRRAGKRYSNAQELYKEALMLFEERRQNASLYNMVAEEATEETWAQIQKFLQTTNRAEFLTLIVDLLIVRGYHISWVTPPEKDHGQIDIVAHVDPLEVGGARILVQVKHTGQAVTMEGLKTFSSILGPNDYGLYVSTGGFTNDAWEKSRSDAFSKTTLWDLEKFFNLWTVNYEKLSREAHTRFPLKAIYFLYKLSDVE